MIQGTVESVGEIAVGDDGDEGDGRVQYLSAVETELPLPDQDWTWGDEPGWDCEDGYAEDATCESCQSYSRAEAASASSEECCPPEQNAEAVMPIVWATRIAAGRGAIATKCSEKLVDAWIV